MLVTAVMEVADLTIPGLNPPNPAVVMRLILTLLFLPVAGLARTWDLMRLGTNALATALRNRVWAAPSLSTTLVTNGYPLLSSANTAGVNLTTGRRASRDEKTSGWFKIERMSLYLVTTQACISSL